MNFFTNPIERTIEAFCNGASFTARVHKPASLTFHYTYTQGYQWNLTTARWDGFTYSCSEPIIAGAWCPATASVVLNRTNPSFVSYACSWLGDDWKCGCADVDCDSAFWQIQRAE